VEADRLCKRQEAAELYKQGAKILLNVLKSETSLKERQKDVIRLKINEYMDRIDELNQQSVTTTNIAAATTTSAPGAYPAVPSVAEEPVSHASSSSAHFLSNLTASPAATMAAMGAISKMGNSVVESKQENLGTIVSASESSQNTLKTALGTAAAGAIGGAVLVGGVLGAPVIGMVAGAGAAVYASTRKDEVGTAAKATGQATLAAAQNARRFDDEHQIVSKSKAAAAAVANKTVQVNQEYGVTDKLGTAAKYTWDSAVSLNDKYKVTNTIGKGISQGLDLISGDGKK